MNIPDWMNDSRINSIDPRKMQMLIKLAEQIEGKKTQKEIMPLVMGAIASANRQNLHFTPEEFDLIFLIMKEGKSEAEKQQMDATLKKAQQMFQRRK